MKRCNRVSDEKVIGSYYHPLNYLDPVMAYQKSFNMIYANLHMHSNYSDGVLEIEEVLTKAKPVFK